MDFLIGSPFSTPVGQRIEQATSSTLQSEDWGLNMEICDIINETEEGPKDAVKAIKKRIVGNKNFREVMLALTVLEACVKNCGHRFHVLVSTREFVEGVLVRAIMPKNNPPMILQDRVLSLIQAWADAFRSSPSLTGVVSVYEDLRRRGLEFPMANLETMSPIHTPHKSVQNDQLPVTAPTTQSAAPPAPTPSQPPAPLPNSEGPLAITPDQLAKLRADLEVVRGNLTVMTEMMNQLDPVHAKESDTELLQQLYTVCKCMQDRIVELIPRLTEEALIEELLVMNDDFNSTFTRYHRFEKHCSGQKPPEQAVEATYENLIDLSPTPTSVNQPVVTALPSYKPISQSAVGALSNQMAGLTTGTDDEFDMFAQSRSRSVAEQKKSVDYENLGAVERQAGNVDTRRRTAGGIPIAQTNVMDDIEKWLSVDEEEDLDESEGVTSEEFDKFLEERAKAADRLPTLRATPSATASPQTQPTQQPDRSHDQLFTL
ncbi:hypothetical protein MATL_G00210230 [Megalops atlanticus]|uniref:Target of Myb protein 1 n=1 Tax=Megalops atlanticus TaxID=7932 RepID=A0A9D3T3J0_MEGAT|nr:hypothetical protein MATL_G00210230 [Megalops atlanticus]